jgi:hypothetical protein
MLKNPYEPVLKTHFPLVEMNYTWLFVMVSITSVYLLPEGGYIVSIAENTLVTARPFYSIVPNIFHSVLHYWLLNSPGTLEEEKAS